MSACNTMEKMNEKRALYREIGAEETWIVDEDGSDDEREASQIAPDCPDTVPAA